MKKTDRKERYTLLFSSGRMGRNITKRGRNSCIFTWSDVYLVSDLLQYRALYRQHRPTTSSVWSGRAFFAVLHAYMWLVSDADAYPERNPLPRF